MRPELKIIVLAAFACACAFAAVAEEHVGRNLERGEPQRWSQSDDTPQKKYDTATKEAKAALADAMKECRASATESKTCEKQARDQFKLDMEAARALLGR